MSIKTMTEQEFRRYMLLKIEQIEKRLYDLENPPKYAYTRPKPVK